MWFLIAILILLWLIGFISLGQTAYWIHLLLVGVVILIIMHALRNRRKSA
ncbi:MAG: lmo0937 family membrane protein [Bacteroidota bacterium]|nr:lmo0937 family membrane protein [Bacteroidota bacterium]MDP4233283.1 lmo0937 family membrane protein [Bacteroidota bacterium]MDP4242097.1 lmo0937 family membrane protein [Bacteroidota bacterium]MDP4288624.1 lmo0937 family membrane protein [Bacteroidota bacterium]